MGPKTGKHLISKGANILEPSYRKTGSVASAPIWLLILTMGCGAVGLTIISPSLKSVAEEFDVDSATAQFLLSGYFIAIASSQLIYGPMSDRYGRRKPAPDRHGALCHGRYTRSLRCFHHYPDLREDPARAWCCSYSFNRQGHHK